MTDRSSRSPDTGVAPGAGGGLPIAGADVTDAVTAAVLAVDGVGSMHGGIFGEAATYLPGRRVLGVRIRPAGTDVNVVAEPGYALPALADRIRVAVLAVPGVVAPVNVFIDGIDDHPVPGQRQPEDPQPPETPTTTDPSTTEAPGTGPSEETTP